MLSDHKPIVLQLCVKEELVRYHFKFNSAWLKDLDLIHLFKDTCISYFFVEGDSNMTFLVKKLSALKYKFISLERDKKKASETRSFKKVFYGHHKSRFFLDSDLQYVKYMEDIRIHILSIEE